MPPKLAGQSGVNGALLCTLGNSSCLTLQFVSSSLAVTCSLDV